MARKSSLTIGDDLTLPADAVAQTFAVMGIRRAGKTTTAKVMAEQMCRAQLPWIALDPVGVWWGLRSNIDGSPSDLPIVVFGGKHADLPLERDQGAAIARAIIAGNVCAVIDMSGESKTFWRTFLVDFCLELMELEPEQPWHVFIEEAPEFCPQRGTTDLTKRTTEAVERLIRLGGNRGYGATIITQRPARVNKDVLSQCENLFVLRTTGHHDRKALNEWLEAQDAEDFKFTGLGKLNDGEAYFWSPQWLGEFKRLAVNPSTTFHPGRTRSAGRSKAKSAQLGDVSRFVSDLVVQLAREKDAPPKASPFKTGKAKLEKSAASKRQYPKGNAEKKLAEAEALIEKMRGELKQLREDLHRERSAATALRRQLDRAKKALQPIGDAYLVLTDNGDAGGVQGRREVWEPWIAKCGPGVKRRMFEVLLEHGTRTRRQLATLANTSVNSSTFRNALSWFRKNALISEDGDRVGLADIV